MRKPKRNQDVEWVAHLLHSIMRFSLDPVSHDELTDRVLDHAIAAFGLDWKRRSAARRVNDGIDLLFDWDCPVISAGSGFRLASRATRAECERAAQLTEKMALRLFVKARKIRAAAAKGEPVQGALKSVAPGFEVQAARTP